MNYLKLIRAQHGIALFGVKPLQYMCMYMYIYMYMYICLSFHIDLLSPLSLSSPSTSTHAGLTATYYMTYM